MPSKWREAGGEWQFAFMGAASRMLRGERDIVCPKCVQTTLRCYYHIFDAERNRGTIWAWCSACHTRGHLPRLTAPLHLRFPDPFKELSKGGFAVLELGAQLEFFDRLTALWDAGEIGYPEIVSDELKKPLSHP